MYIYYIYIDIDIDTDIYSALICFVLKILFFELCRVLPLVLVLLYRKHTVITFALTYLSSSASIIPQ